MKNSVLSFIIFLPLFLQSQSLLEQAEAIEMTITVTSQDVVINDENPILIKRAESNSESEYDFDVHAGSDAAHGYGYGFGYGYVSWHLEFVGNKDIRTDRKRYQLSFIDSTEKTLGFLRFDEVDVDVVTVKDTGVYFYSIDFKEVPIMLLNRTARIEIRAF